MKKPKLSSIDQAVQDERSRQAIAYLREQSENIKQTQSPLSRFPR